VAKLFPEETCLLSSQVFATCVEYVGRLPPLAAPVYSRFRDDATTTHSTSALKNAALAAESWSISNAGDFGSMTYQSLLDEGYADDPGSTSTART